MFVCPTCGAQVPSNAQFCQNCGTVINQENIVTTNVLSEGTPMSCQRCGAPLESNAAFCQNCGMPLQSEPKGQSAYSDGQVVYSPVEQSNYVGYTPVAQKKSKAPVLITVFSILGVLLIGVIAALLILFNPFGGADKTKETEPVHTHIYTESLTTEPVPETEEVTEPAVEIWTISFDVNGGVMDDGINSDYVCHTGDAYDDIMPRFPTASREGYLFDGWQLENRHYILREEDYHVSKYPFYQDSKFVAIWIEEPTEADPVKNFIENSGNRLFTINDIEAFTAEQCRLARNGIYARHGRMFNDEVLQEYYMQFDWYRPTVAPEDFSESVLNDYELANRDLIIEYETAHGYR